ncbi:MAG: flagellar hook-basal body complex protein FliE [Alphaproteobacteria bacterium]
MIDVSKALGSYATTAISGNKPGMEPRDVSGPDFATVLEESAKTAINQIQASEEMSAKAMTGDANLTDVVLAVNNAEMTLQSVVAVRDRVIGAYQEIMRMQM